MSVTPARRRPDLSRNLLAQEIAASRSAEFMEALVAACALMAYADGEVAGAERRRIYAAARNEPALAAYSHVDVVEEFSIHEAQFNMDPEIAIEIATEKLAAVRDKPSEVKAILNACRNILVADGIAHPAEYRSLTKIKAILGLNAPVA